MSVAPTREQRDRVMSATRIAMEYFSGQLLNSPEAQPARDLLTARGLGGPEITEHFGCGYAPSDHSLLNLLRAQGYTDDEMVEASLASRSDDGRVYPYFRHRLLWAIRNTFGKPIGFGARRLQEDQKAAKFINTRQTLIYRKSKVLYGLNDARKTISKHHHVIVVEGYTDVMAMHLSGVTNAVATCGISFTEDHFHALRTLVGEEGEITFGLDDDEAGRAATMKVYVEVKDGLRRLSVLPCSEGLDPDDYRQAHGNAALAAMVADRVPLRRRSFTWTLAQRPLRWPEDRAVALDAALPLVSEEPDPGERALFLRVLAIVCERSVEDIAERLCEVMPASTPGDRYRVLHGAVEAVLDASDKGVAAVRRAVQQAYLRALAAGVEPAEAHRVLDTAVEAAGLLPERVAGRLGGLVHEEAGV